MNNELAIRILEALNEQWFKDYLNGIPFQLFQSKFSEAPNEILQTLEALENSYLIKRNDIGWYVITTAGIDVFEENLSPSIVSKINSERRNVMELLKELYDTDIYQTIDHETLMTKVKISDFRYLLGIVVYLEEKGLVVLDMVIGGAFQIRLTPAGNEALLNQTFSNALVMKNAYAILFNIENHLRDFLELKLSTKLGSDWWNLGIPKGIRDKVDQMKRDENNIGWKVTNTRGNIEFLSFEHIQKIIANNWKDVFEPIFQDQNKIILKLTELEIIRNAIAHTRTLSDEGMKRLEQYAQDILNLT